MLRNKWSGRKQEARLLVFDRARSEHGQLFPRVFVFILKRMSFGNGGANRAL